MELQIGQVAKECGVTIRMLRYYEEIGLIDSRRKGDGSYRVYDESTVQKLRQIIVLRKLRVSVKQIGEILANPNAAVVVDIFKQNIDELDEEIATLATVKSILNQFVEKLQEAAHIRLELDFASDEAVLSAIESVSFTKNHKKENYTMEDLNRAKENLEKAKEKNVRVVFLPRMTVASAYAISDNPWEATKSIIKKFTKDVDLFKIKPDYRNFGFGNHREGHWVYEIMVSIPDDLDVPAPLMKSIYPGGLYAGYISNPVDFDADMNIARKWVENSDIFEWRVGEPQLEEAFNPGNVYGLKNIDIDECGFMYIDFLLPIKEIEKTEYKT